MIPGCRVSSSETLDRQAVLGCHPDTQRKVMSQTGLQLFKPMDNTQYEFLSADAHQVQTTELVRLQNWKVVQGLNNPIRMKIFMCSAQLF